MLKFSSTNSKMIKLTTLLGIKKSELVAFDLPAGWSCPMASKCLSKANRDTGKITDGAEAEFRCYAASLESAFSATRKAHWHNFDLLRGKSTAQMAELILESIPKGVRVMRVHASGDFFNRDYFNAWLLVANARQDITFFGYTKILPYVSIANELINFKLVYSYGGKLDNMVTTEPVSYVVNTISDGIIRGLEVACQIHPSDDYNFIMAGKSFALALHGTQPAKKK